MNEPYEPSPPMEAVCERYLRLRRATWHPTTVCRQRAILRRFLRSLRESDPRLEQFDQLRRDPHIEHWLSALLPLQPSTRCARLWAVACFLHTQIDQGWPNPPPENLVHADDFPRIPPQLPKPLDPANDQRLQQTLRQEPCVRSLAFLLLRHTGVRIGELLALRLEAITLDAERKPVLRIPPAKTYRERLIPLSEDSAGILGEILRRRGSQHPPAPEHAHRLLVDELGRPLSYSSLWRYLNAISRRFDCRPPYTLRPHRLRHTFATELARTDIPLPSLMRLLGHERPNMTMRYVELSGHDIRHAYEQAMRQLPALPVRPTTSAADPHEPETQIAQQFQRLIARIDHHRRDHQADPHRARTLNRLVKRLRAAHTAFQKSP